MRYEDRESEAFGKYQWGAIRGMWWAWRASYKNGISPISLKSAHPPGVMRLRGVLTEKRGKQFMSHRKIGKRTSPIFRPTAKWCCIAYSNCSAPPQPNKKITLRRQPANHYKIEYSESRLVGD